MPTTEELTKYGKNNNSSKTRNNATIFFVYVHLKSQF